MSKVALVTDSTTYMPPDLVRQYSISVAPQVLIWGDQTYKDGVDIQSQEFFTRLKTTKVMPTTSQVAVVSFQEIFQDLVNKDHEVIALLVSSRLSGSVQSPRGGFAWPASERSMWSTVSRLPRLGFQVLAVACWRSASLKEAIELAENPIKIPGVFRRDTLNSSTAAGVLAVTTLGTMLNMKILPYRW
jgi:DegV family protein with EDD domain